MHGAGSSGIVPQGGQLARYAEGPAVRRCHAPPDSGTFTRISGNCYWVTVAWLPI